MTTPIDPNDLPDPADKLKAAVETAQAKAKQALQTGQDYVRSNPVPVALGALVVGVVLGALLAPRPRKPADPVQSVRDWLEESLSDISHRIPDVKKRACGLSHDVRDQVSDLGRKLKIW